MRGPGSSASPRTIPRATPSSPANTSLGVKLASDLDGSVCEAFGTWGEKSLYGRKYMGIDRATFLIDRDGTVARVWRKVKRARPCRGGARRGAGTAVTASEATGGERPGGGFVYGSCSGSVSS